MVPRRIVVAMSGGVDSSVAAVLLRRQGHEVIGLMMRLWSASSGNRCCTPNAMAMARRVAGDHDIPFYVVDAQAAFKDKVVDFFMDGLQSGVTPNPCLECNRHIRWDFLLKQALALGGDSLATGHYARVRKRHGRFELLKAVDADKDQSYVLSVMGQNQLRHACFPIGEYTKSEVRELAREFDLPVAERRDSQDLCFLGRDGAAGFLARQAGTALAPGPIVTRDGRQLGEHAGLALYTIGQRKGIGLAAPHPMYVLEKNVARNALIVGPAEALGWDRLVAGRMHWVAGAPPAGTFRAMVKIRYKAPEAPASVQVVDTDHIDVRVDVPLRDVTPGQAAVLYDGDSCLGSGTIVWPAETGESAIARHRLVGETVPAP